MKRKPWKQVSKMNRARRDKYFADVHASERHDACEVLRRLMPDLRDEQVVKVDACWRTESLFGRMLMSGAQRVEADLVAARRREVIFKSSSVLRRFIKVAKAHKLVARPFHPIKHRGMNWVKTQHPVSVVVDWSELVRFILPPPPVVNRDLFKDRVFQNAKVSLEDAMSQGIGFNGDKKIGEVARYFNQILFKKSERLTVDELTGVIARLRNAIL